MLHIIVLLLKFIGIILLAILGLLLALLLIILLVPIKYKVWISHGSLFRLEGRASWILHIIRIRVIKEAERFHIRLRLFGIPLYDSERSRKVGKLRRRREKGQRRKQDAARKGKGPGQQTTPEQLSQEDITEKPEALPEKDTAPAQRTAAGTGQLPGEQCDSGGKPKEQTDSDYGGNLKGHTDFGEESKEHGYSAFVGEPLEDEPDSEGSEAEEDQESRATGFGKRLRKIKGSIAGVRKKLSGLLERIRRGWQAMRRIKNKIGLVKSFLREEENKTAFRVTFGSLKKLLKHIRPRKLKSKVTFGTGDPCSTGQALGAISILYGYYGENVRITPDFENKVFAGSHYARGRIRIGTLLIIVIKLLIDKNFKQLKRNFIILKEEL